MSISGTETQNERDNAELVRRHFDVLWNHGRLTAVEDFFSADFTNFGRRGPDAHAVIRAIVTAWRTAFPDLHYVIDDEIVSGDAVVHRVTLTGTHAGTFDHPAVGVLPPTGRTFSVDQVHITRVRDGRIVEHWGTRNDLAMLQQLGAIPTPRKPATITESAGWQAPQT